MLIKTLCLAAAAPGQDIPSALEDVAARALRALPGLREAIVNRVLRHIPTDSLNDQKSHNGVVAEADAIQACVDLYFDDAQSAADAVGKPAWPAFLTQLKAVAMPLFMLDSEPNIPIPPRGAAADGGFRRWMLLARKANTQPEFREAWFGRHASLVKQLPGVDGYLQNLVSARYDGAGRPVAYEVLPIDGIAELCFADEDAMKASYASDARLPLRDDGRDLLGRITTVLVQGKAFR